MIMPMKKNAYDYLHKSLERLEKWLPFSVDEMMENYMRGSRINDYDIEEDEQNHVYCLFAWPETDSERIVLLVYDEEMHIIADLSAVHCNVNQLLYSKELYDSLSLESDWMYLSHYTLCASMFPSLPYPACESTERTQMKGEALLYSNAYVTRSYRRNGIFTFMVNMTRDFVLRFSKGSTVLLSVISLDPDVAVYGPDAVSTPYHYSFEIDEPVRMENCEVMKHLGFEPLRLEETQEDPEADGTKLWFAIRKETDVIIETGQFRSA